MNQTIRLAVVALCYALSISIRMEAAEFIPLGNFDGVTSGTVARGISHDGSAIVGHGSRTSDTFSVVDAFRWTDVSGLANLQTLPLPGAPRTSAKSVSDGGNVVVGSIDYYGSPLISEAFRWTAADGIVGLGFLNDSGLQFGHAIDTTADGGIIVGWTSSVDSASEAFRWSADSGMTGLGDLPGGEFSSSATGISADGNVIVGAGNSQLGQEAFLWTQETGMVPLGDLPGGFFGSLATAVSADGRTVVGESFSTHSEGTLEAFRWTQGTGIQPIGDLPGGIFTSTAASVSGDGKIVVGWSDDEEGIKAFVWDEFHGIRDLQEALVNEHSLSEPLLNWRLLTAQDISRDGLSIVGHGINPNGNIEAYLVRLDRPLTAPEPSSLALLLGATLLAALGRRRR